MPDDRIQREIEDILNRLDAFVPEEKQPSRVRRSSDTAAAFALAFLGPLARISLRQVMLTGLALVVFGFIALRVQPLFGQWVLVAGLILFFTTFALSFFNRAPARGPEKRWRGRSVDLEPPSLGERLRAWLEAKRRSRR